MIKVSIICFTYNHAKLIKMALDSFLAQKASFNIEVLVHDDASTDGTQTILNDYKRKHPEVFKLKFEQENQVSKNNTRFIDEMFKESAGEYIALCDGDDYWTDPNKLQKQVAFMESHPECALVFHPVKVIYEKPKKQSTVYPLETEGFTTIELLRRNYIQTNSVLYRRQNYSDMVIDFLPGDWYLHLYHAHSGDIGFIPEIMAVYRVHAGGMWHESHKNYTSILAKYGVQWLGMHLAVYELYKNNEAYRKILAGNIINVLRNMREISKDYPDIILKATSKYPFAAMLYIDNLHEQLDDLHSHADKQAELIEHYKVLSETLQSNIKASHHNTEFARKIYKNLRHDKE